MTQDTPGLDKAYALNAVPTHAITLTIPALLAARRVPDYRAAVASQIPLAVVMVAYTLFGLWLLSSPVAG